VPHRRLRDRLPPALTDLSALGELTSLLEFTARRTGIVDLPTFDPGFGALRFISLEGNPALADIGGLASWGTHPDEAITVHLVDNRPAPPCCTTCPISPWSETRS